MQLPALRREERATLQLRALYEQQGYRLYRMGSFEEYDLYSQNRPFLKAGEMITFTAGDGRLMALKPDVTLSIVKNTPAGDERKAYYNENVFRRSRRTGEYREIHQIGLERIGSITPDVEAEVLLLAAQSLSAFGTAALDLSHMGFINAILKPLSNGARQQAQWALDAKSPHAMREALKKADLPPQYADALVRLATLSGEYEAVLPEVQRIASQVPGATPPLQELAAQCETLRQAGTGVQVRLDFSIINDADYYNGLVFQGFVKGASDAALSGGRYDNLLRRLEKPQDAIGFALYLDELTQPENAPRAGGDDYLNIALPKGRLGDKVYNLFAQAGCGCEEILEQSRKLVFENPATKTRYFLVKPSDVDIYVEHGAADIGVAGKDVLAESSADVLELLDLQLGICYLAVIGHPDYTEDPALPLRVATKYPNITQRYYAAQGRAVEVIQLHGSIELAPILNLADVVVDIVETGATLKENNLATLQDVMPVSARLVANRSAWRFKGDVIQKLVKELEVLL